MTLAAVVLLPCAVTAAGSAFDVVETDATITIVHGSTPVLVYHKAEDPAPAGADPAFKRSAFIHPLHAPSGAPLTQIRPADHLHHMGLWHAWVRCDFRGQPVDFWNLGGKTGTVRYRKTLSVDRRPDRAGFAVEQEHVAFHKDGGEAVVLRERFTVRARFVGGANVINYVMAQTNVTDAPLELAAYRYGGGVAFRGPAAWNLENSGYLTSEGKTRADSHQSRARWCAAYGPAGRGEATVVLLCHPSNRDAPQRLRTWPKEHNGAIFMNFVPIQESAWAIRPGEEIVLRYQVLTFDGRPEAAELDARWTAFANEPAD